VLRRAIIGYGILAILAALVIFLSLGAQAFGGWLLLNGLVVLAAIVFERGRYRPRRQGGERWEDTGERFIDPTSGRLIEVRFDPQTGKRDYVEVPGPDGGGKAG
jgi:hypothetical protein